jgi:hypothetical protein
MKSQAKCKLCLICSRGGAVAGARLQCSSIFPKIEIGVDHDSCLQVITPAEATSKKPLSVVKPRSHPLLRSSENAQLRVRPNKRTVGLAYHRDGYTDQSGRRVGL